MWLPLCTHHLHYLPHLLSGGHTLFQYFPERPACLWGAYVSALSLGPFQPGASGPLVADPQIFIIISSLWGEGLMSPNFENHLSSPIVNWLLLCQMKPTLCSVPSEVLCCLRTGCWWARTDCHHVNGESRDIILQAHTYLSAKDISGQLCACTGKGIQSHLNWDNPGSGYILWYYICQLTFSPCIYNYSTVSMH